MTRTMVAVLMALSPVAVSFAQPDVMLCLHRDGHVRVETFEPTCCRGEEEAPACPDEGCQDLPVIDSGPTASPDAGFTLDLCSMPADPPVVLLPFISVPELRRPRSYSGPPERHVSIVVLRC